MVMRFINRILGRSCQKTPARIEQLTVNVSCDLGDMVVGLGAYETIRAVMEKGAQNHAPGSWKKQDAQEHFAHAWQHLQSVNHHGLGKIDDATGLPEMHHALCRLPHKINQPTKRI